MNTNYMNIRLLIVPMIMGALMMSLGCNTDDDQMRPDRSWELTWSDEFDGDAGAAPDMTKWTYDIGRGNDGWGNQELQYYSDRPENVSLDGNGNLVITALNESFGGANFSSGRIKTEGIFDQQYGRWEARIKLPSGPGIWPAFWMLGANIDEVGWPQCGEIDILEARGQQPSIILGSVHGPGYSAGNSISDSYSLLDGRFDSDFHTFSIEWGPGYIDYFADGFWYQRITPEDVPGEWVFDNSFFMLLNIAVGGNFVGFPAPSTPFPQKMYVDYVRVYSQVD